MGSKGANLGTENPEMGETAPAWTPREQDMLLALAGGKSQKDIAESASVSKNTIQRFARREDVRTEVERLRAERWEEASNLATSCHSLAVQAAVDLLLSGDEMIKLKAATLVHKMCHDFKGIEINSTLEKFAEKVAKIINKAG